MTATMTTVAGILKEMYEGTVVDQLQENAVTAKRIESNADGIVSTVGGKFVHFPIRTQRNHGISYRDENTLLAPAGSQKYVQSQESLKNGYARVAFTGQVMELASSNPQAFVNAMDEEISMVRLDIQRDVNRQMYGHADGYATTGGTGVISKLTANSTASTTVTALLNNVIEVGMVIDIVTAANPAVPVAGCTGLTVVTVAQAGTSFTVDSAITATSGQYIVRTGNWNKEILGLTAIVAQTGSIHGINPATAGSEKWAAAKDDSTTTTLTESVMITGVDTMKIAGGDEPTAVFCSLGVRRAYYDIFTSLRRYNEPKNWPGGLVGLTFNTGTTDIPLVSDLDCPTSNMYMLNEKQFTIYSPQDWHFDDSDGNMLKWVPGYDKYEAYLKRYWQLVCHKRNATARWTALTEH